MDTLDTKTPSPFLRTPLEMRLPSRKSAIIVRLIAGWHRQIARCRSMAYVACVSPQIVTYPPRI
jgi:hypothetical protein